MPSITFDDFKGGLDLRRNPSTSSGNTFTELTNAYVTAGREVSIRPGVKALDVHTGNTFGLFAARGVLNTFYRGDKVTTSTPPAGVAARDIQHARNLFNIQEVVQVETFAGYLYVVCRHNDGNYSHIYLDSGNYELWSPSTVYPAGSIVIDNRRLIMLQTQSGSPTSGSSTPSWGDAGTTTVDGGCRWLCQGNAVFDSNCPNGSQVVVLADHVFSLPRILLSGSQVIEGDTIPFSAAGNARDWTTSGDAGFLPVGRHAKGGGSPKGLGEYRGDLVVFFADSAQVWSVDPDPQNMYLKQIIDSAGTAHQKTIANLSGDLFFLSGKGFKSIAQTSYSESLIDIDIGSAIENETPKPSAGKAIYSSGRGAYFWLNESSPSSAYVYTFSRASKISAWSKWDFGLKFDYVTELNGVIYLGKRRTSTGFIEIYYLDTDYYFDDDLSEETATAVTATITQPFLDFGKPGVEKQIFSMDIAFSGSATISFRPNYEESVQESIDASYAQDWSHSGVTIPVDIQSPLVSLSFEATDNFTLSAYTLHYELNSIT